MTNNKVNTYLTLSFPYSVLLELLICFSHTTGATTTTATITASFALLMTHYASHNDAYN